jgi:hypothetical protein
MKGRVQAVIGPAPPVLVEPREPEGHGECWECNRPTQGAWAVGWDGRAWHMGCWPPVENGPASSLQQTAARENERVKDGIAWRFAPDAPALSVAGGQLELFAPNVLKPQDNTSPPKLQVVVDVAKKR